MAFLIYLLCTALIQFSTGHIATLNGQGSINAQRPHHGNVLPGAGLLTPNAPSARGLGAMPGTNPLTRNVALSGNGLAYVVKGNLANANSNVVIGNIANKLASANVATANSGASNMAKPNLAKSTNFVNSGFGNQLLSANNSNPIHPGSIASSKALSKYQLSSSYPQKYGNYANKNTASNLANNGWYPNMPIGSSYSQSVLNGALDNQEYGIYVQADGLEIAGNVAVTGSMPLYGTVSLNGKLPTEGSATVNYACSG